SDPNTGSATSQIAIIPERWPGNIAYALSPPRSAGYCKAASDARDLPSVMGVHQRLGGTSRPLLGLFRHALK
ncbi:hypothetical protein, partial [Mesorhizobium sp. B3-1-6]|uniref:hypothetical protein n=1 Tax=Mesorhizobium sp. B3-1-6 TaxID=2589895 RepID=UPI001AEE069F